MKIPIPKTIFGAPIAGARERAKEMYKNKTPTGGENQPPQTFPKNITLSDYLQVPNVVGIHGKPVIISKFEIQEANNLNYNGAHEFALKQGLYVPTPSIFMPHFNNVISTYKNKQPLLDGEGNPIPREEHEDIYKHLTTNHKVVYAGGREGAWTWLNARFVEGTGFNNLDLETITDLLSDGNFQTIKSPLQITLNEDTYAELSFNPQGLPISKSKVQKYKQGDNFYFWKPVLNRVARFYAGSGRARLNCSRDPSIRNASLGVFGCAEGTDVQKI